jgi:hypothetical protein
MWFLIFRCIWYLRSVLFFFTIIFHSLLSFLLKLKNFSFFKLLHTLIWRKIRFFHINLESVIFSFLNLLFFLFWFFMIDLWYYHFRLILLDVLNFIRFILILIVLILFLLLSFLLLLLWLFLSIIILSGNFISTTPFSWLFI